mgnify:CR=1 FL=1
MAGCSCPEQQPGLCGIRSGMVPAPAIYQEPMLEVFRHAVGVMPLYFLKQRLK